MLIRFSVENWLSYRDKVTFSMVASKERQHNDRLNKVSKHEIKISPIAAIYGGNASGKTNFFRAINFVKNLIVMGTMPDKPVPVQTFMLDKESINKESKFGVELLLEGNIYEYSFTVTREEIKSEKLILIKPYSEVELFNREKSENQFKDDEFLKFALKGTRKNQLFLTNSVNQNIDNFKSIYDWFNNNLVLIAPDARFGKEIYFNAKTNVVDVISNIINKLDTGIEEVVKHEVPFENLPYPQALKDDLMNNLKEGDNAKIMASGQYSEIIREIVSLKNGKLVANRLKTKHKMKNGENILFELEQESDGTKRMLDLIPILFEPNKNKKVILIDEIDRSLHPILTRTLIELYINKYSKNSMSQLLLTTHDISLMSQEIFRRDEMWLTKREKDGNTKIYPISDFEGIRYDKDIRKSYLQGRFGGIPHPSLNDSFDKECNGNN